VQAAGERGADVGNGGLAVGRIEGGEFDGDLGPGSVEELFDRGGARAEGRFGAETGRVDGGAVAEGVDAGDGEGKVAAAGAQQAVEGAADIAVADKCELQKKILPDAGLYSGRDMPGRIKILVTGGTFDKEYNELTGELFFKETHVCDMLRLGRCRVDVAVETLMMIDSLQMTEADRRLVLERCQECVEGRIVITHGTDTMQETAAVLGREIHDKTIVLTGAMVPYQFGSSDGMFNLGTALAFVQALEPGVYVAMNGRYFLWNAVHKNRELGVFEPTPETGR
jgi:L-asparaginase